MKKKDLAKMLDIDVSTIWRWNREGILDRKIAEYQKMLEIKTQNAGVEIKEIMQKILEKLEKIDRTPEMLPNIVLVLQYILSELQNRAAVPQVSKPMISETKTSEKTIEPEKEHTEEVK